MTSWWLEGGVDPANCFGAYQGQYAASLAASKVNLNNPGVHDLTHGIVNQAGETVDIPEPTWDETNGWFAGAGQYWRITDGAFPTETWSVVIQFTDAGIASMQFCGAMNADQTGPNGGLAISNVGAFRDFANFGSGLVGGTLTDGNMGIAGKGIFIDGVKNGVPIDAGSDTADWEWFLGTSNWQGKCHGNGTGCYFQAFAIYNATLTDGQMVAIQTAMAGLTPPGPGVTESTGGRRGRVMVHI